MMTKVGTLAIGAAGLLLGTQAMAQQTHYWAAPVSPNQGARTYFPAGTPLTLRTRTEVNTKQAKPGDRVYLDVAESLTYRGQVVIPAGTVAVAEVARSERNGHFGKRGEVIVRLLHVETPYGPVRLTGDASDQGRSGTAASVATIALVSPLGFLIHGTSGRLPFGTVVTGYLGEDLRFVSRPPDVAVAAAEPDARPVLPARFDPTVFGGSARTGSR